MALAGTGKWEQLGAAMVRCAGPKLHKLHAGIDAGITVENAGTGMDRWPAEKATWQEEAGRFAPNS